MAAKQEHLSIGTFLLVKVAWEAKPYLMLIESISEQWLVLRATDRPHFTLQIPRIEGRTLEYVSLGDGGQLH